MDGTVIESKSKQRSPFIMSRGMKFPKDNQFIKGQIRGALRKDMYEGKESDAVMKVVRDDDVVIELGAGIGYMSTLVATKRKLKAVYAYEANPNLIPYIHAVHAANNVKNAHVHNAILGARKGTVDFYPRKNLLASSLVPKEGEEAPYSVKVDVLNAKQVMKETQANVLICDIEGAEADLIPAMDLSGLRAAVIELHPQWIGPDGVNAVFRAFMDAGLAYYSRGSTRKVVSFRRSW